MDVLAFTAKKLYIVEEHRERKGNKYKFMFIHLRTIIIKNII